MCARSAALMPVLMPARASTETVYAVPRGSSLRATMGGSASRSATSSGIGAQTTPEVWRIVHASHSVGRGRRGEDDVALVLAVLVVGHQHGPARAQRREGGVDRSQRAHAATSLGSRSGACVRETRSQTKKP